MFGPSDFSARGESGQRARCQCQPVSQGGIGAAPRLPPSRAARPRDCSAQHRLDLAVLGRPRADGGRVKVLRHVPPMRSRRAAPLGQVPGGLKG